MKKIVLAAIIGVMGVAPVYAFMGETNPSQLAIPDNLRIEDHNPKGSMQELRKLVHRGVSNLVSKGNLSDKGFVLLGTPHSSSTLDKSSVLGRTVGDMVSASLANNGVKLKFLRLSNQLDINSEGEFMTTRDKLKLFNDEYPVEAYIDVALDILDKELVITLQLVGMEAGQVLAGETIVMPVPKSLIK